MVNYRRAYRASGTWFFTVNLLQRQQNDLLISQISLLKVYVAIRKVYTNLTAITLKANRGYAGLAKCLKNYRTITIIAPF